MTTFLVTHPGLQHSHQLALALYEHGLLQGFWSGVPVLAEGEAVPFFLPASYANRLKKADIPKALRRHLLLFQALLRSGRVFSHWMPADEYAHRVFHAFDWWVSRQLPKLKPRVVVAYENSAYHTFRAAKAIGARCVLDAASLHHSAGTRMGVVADTPFRREINRRKDEEVELADLVLTCSPLAAESYHAAGVPADKLRPVLLGTDLPQGIGQWQPHQHPLHFIFAGALSYRKSIDLILAAFRRLHQENLVAEVTFVGGLAEARWLKEIEQTPNAHYVPGVPQRELFKLLSQADCLLLPSRFDSFGMVVAEAMACGTPAIVSNRTGAKALIEQFPKAGWIVEADENSLYQCLRARIDDRHSLFTAREHALQAAQHFTWTAYRQRVGDLLQDFAG